MRLGRFSLVFAAGALGLLLAGPTSMAKVAHLLGFTQIAGDLAGDPILRGVGSYEAGEYVAADAAFETAGRQATYNRGLSLAATGDWRLSVAYFDAVLFADPSDEEARRNRDLVAALVEPDVGDPAGEGRIASAIAKIGAADAAEAARLQLPDASKIRRPLDYGSLAADLDWLGAITDDPGTFLKQVLRAEYDRRTASGLVRPSEADPW